MKIAHADVGAARSLSLQSRSPSRGFEAVLGDAAKVQAASDHRALGFGELGMFGRSAANGAAATLDHPPAAAALEQPAEGKGSIDRPLAALAAPVTINGSVWGQGVPLLLTEMASHEVGVSTQIDAVSQTTPPVATFGPSGQDQKASSDRTANGVLRTAPKPLFRSEQLRSSASLVAHEEDGLLSVIALTDDPSDHAHIRSRLAEVAQEFDMSLTELVLNGAADEGVYNPEIRNEKWR